MKMTILFFASFRERMKSDRLLVDLPAGSLAGDVLNIVCQNLEEANMWRRSMKIAVNECYVSNETPLNEGDCVALIPPVAGG